MSNVNRQIRKAHAGDWPAIRALLLGAGLPVADLDAAALDRFLLETQTLDGEENIAGAVGLEVNEDAGLLRSLVVDPSCRGTGCGSRLVTAIEGLARESGVGELWLLTIDASEFFAARSYVVVSRELAPPAIRDTAEFSRLCPDSAVLMTRKLR